MSELYTTKIFERNEQSAQYVVINRGGTRSSKTYSLMQLAALWLLGDSPLGGEVWSVVRKSLPALKASALRDFKVILVNLGIFELIKENKTELSFSYGGRMVEFFSLDDEAKVRSRKRDVCHMVESNEMAFEDFTQLSIRTSKKMYIDFNPDDSYIWINEELEQKRASIKGDVQVIVSNYTSNPFLTKAEVENIEYLKDVDAELWAVFGRGEYGKLLGRIFKQFNEYSKEPSGGAVYWGLDFGFSNDPSALVRVQRVGKNLYLKEFLYEKGLTNDLLAIEIRQHAPAGSLIICDSAEPKSIAELKRHGLNVVGATKGNDSVRAGIDLMRSYKIFHHRDSVNLIKELRLYRWSEKDPAKPLDMYNHLIDAARYVVLKKFKLGRSGFRVT